VATFDKFAHVSALRHAVRRARPVNPDLPAGADALADLLGAQPVRNHYGEHLVARNWFADPQQCPAPHAALELLLPGTKANGPAQAGRGAGSGKHAAALAAQPEKWLFLDTETTGLAGGTGTYAFLVGLGWWDAGGLHVEQLFLRDFTEEHSLLTALAARLAERPVLVTFNGKTFDWPLLETRYRMTRRMDAPEPAVHLDLLHPARQLWRVRWGSVRLSELERNVLGACTPRIGWSREGDVRGDMIPQIYFDYLRGGNPAALLDVLRHNQMDVRGLAALAGRIIALLNQPEHAEADGYELFGVSRMVRQRAPQATGKARALFASAVDAGLPDDLDRRARREMALLARREKDYDRAAAIWESLVGQAFQPVADDSFHQDELQSKTNPRTNVDVCPAITLEACEQLAIHHEHRKRDPRRALQWASHALIELKRLRRTGAHESGSLDRIRYRLYERIARLERKVAAALPLA
jgi:hypothetical protein